MSKFDQYGGQTRHDKLGLLHVTTDHQEVRGVLFADFHCHRNELHLRELLQRLKGLVDDSDQVEVPVCQLGSFLAGPVRYDCLEIVVEKVVDANGGLVVQIGAVDCFLKVIDALERLLDDSPFVVALCQQPFQILKSLAFTLEQHVQRGAAECFCRTSDSVSLSLLLYLYRASVHRADFGNSLVCTLSHLFLFTQKLFAELFYVVQNLPRCGQLRLNAT